MTIWTDSAGNVHVLFASGAHYVVSRNGFTYVRVSTP